MRNSQQHICALIPTYNNGGTILDVVRRVHSFVRDVIIVDDGSTDDTPQLLTTLDFEVTIVTHTRNKGKGAALKSGFKKAIELGFDYALTIDADGQHYPEDIPLLLKALDVHPNNLIVGIRQFTDENMSSKSKFANKFSNFWFRLQTTINLPDTQSGFRIYPLRRLYGLSLLTNRYEAELELLVFSAWHNLQLIPVPVRVYYPPQEQRVSHFKPAKDFTRISILNCFLCLGALLFGYINMYWRTVFCFAIFGVLMLFFVTPYTLLFFLIRGDNPKSRARFHKQMQRLATFYCKGQPGFRYTIDNPHNIHLGDKPSVVICNHQSHMDIILLLSLSPKLVVMVKDYLWYNPIFHFIVRKLNFFPISLDEDAQQQIIKRVTEEGYSLLLYPEGTRTSTGEIGRFHRGAAYYAEKYQLPIQPIIMEGIVDYLNRNQFALKPNKVRVEILPPIAADDPSFGRDFKRRTKSLELHYSALLHSNRLKVAVIGAGVGGLFTGALLAQKGYEVTVLEQLPVYGGGLYSYERDGETWYTGMHILTGVEPEGAVTQLLAQLGIKADVVPTTLDHNPSDLIGEAEWLESHKTVYRFVGGSQKLADQLALFITRHGGRVLLSQQVTAIQMDGAKFKVTNKESLVTSYDAVVSDLHPKQLLAISQIPFYRPATIKRILTTPETSGSFKTYITLKPNTLPYDEVTHYLPENKLLVFTPCSEVGQTFARTIETVMPLDYNDLKPEWKENRQVHYADYECYKKQKEQEVIDLIQAIYPDIRNCMSAVFSSTSLTYRDDYLSPEGAMFGMTQSVGSVRTRVKGLYLTGQNIFLHGLCGVAMTSQLTAQALCEDFD